MVCGLALAAWRPGPARGDGGHGAGRPRRGGEGACAAGGRLPRLAVRRSARVGVGADRPHRRAARPGRGRDAGREPGDRAVVGMARRRHRPAPTSPRSCRSRPRSACSRGGCFVPLGVDKGTDARRGPQPRAARRPRRRRRADVAHPQARPRRPRRRPAGAGGGRRRRCTRGTSSGRCRVLAVVRGRPAGDRRSWRWPSPSPPAPGPRAEASSATSASTRPSPCPCCALALGGLWWWLSPGSARRRSPAPQVVRTPASS